MLRYNKKRTQLAWFTALLSSVARAVTGDQRLKFLCLFRPLRAEHLVNFPSRSRPSPRARPWKALVHRVFFLRPFNELSAFYKKVDASAKTLHYRKNMACVSVSLLIFAISLVSAEEIQPCFIPAGRQNNVETSYVTVRLLLYSCNQIWVA